MIGTSEIGSMRRTDGSARGRESRPRGDLPAPDATARVEGYRPGVVAGVICLHMACYAPVRGFGAAFEATLAAEIGAFLARFDPARDLLLTAWTADDALAGALALDAADAEGEGVRLRWFIVADAARGRGLGAALMARADAHMAARGWTRAWLTTFRGLDAARALYERHGFRLAAEEAADPWSGGVGVQRFARG
jgi:GNAT superfamily N-acetyltransferase